MFNKERIKKLKDRIDELEGKLNDRTLVCTDRSQAPLWNYVHSYSIVTVVETLLAYLELTVTQTPSTIQLKAKKGK